MDRVPRKRRRREVGAGFNGFGLGDGENQQAGIMDASTFPDDALLGWSVYFTVADADATIAAIEAAGGAVVIPAEDTPYGRLAALADSTGAMFKIVA